MIGTHLYKATGTLAEALEGKIHGVTVRDHIAIEAMKAIIPSEANEGEQAFGSTAYLAYRYADAMIAESNKQ